MRRALFWLVASLLFSCTPSSVTHGVVSHSARPSTAASQGGASYGTDPLEQGVRGEAASQDFTDAVAKACAAQDLALDGRLGSLAEKLAASSHGAREAPSYSLVSHEARLAGLIEPTPEVWVASGPSTAALLPALRQQVKAASARAQLTHCGVGAVKEGGSVVVALALSGRFMALREPIPQRVEPGQELVLRGSLIRGYSEPSLAVTDPAGAVSRHALGKGPAIEHTLQLAERGTYTIELLAQGPQGVTVVANFPIGVGVDGNQLAVGAEGPAETSTDEVAEHLLEAIAAERSARNLPALKLDARLTAIALAHDQDMLEHGFIAHTSKTSGEAKDRVKSAGLKANVVLENIGRGYSATEIHQGLMESPGHRGNILHPDARELGIAVVAEQEGTRTAFIATELFTRLTREVSVADAPRELMRGIEQRRKKVKAPAIQLDAAMSRAAQQAAERYASGQQRDENALLAQATNDIGTPPKGIAAVAAALVLADELEQVLDSQRLIDPNLRRLGVGIAKLDASQKHALVLVLLLGLNK
jgi:uncharacterized protein YkwD